MLTNSKLENLADQLLLKIRTQSGKSFNLAALSKSLKASPDDIRSAIEQISQWNYGLQTGSRDVKFISAPDSINATEIGYGLKTKLIGRHVHCYQSVKSTNDLAVRLAETGAPEGTIVTAEQQTGGRGRFGRVWHSPPGCGVYLSVILRPILHPEQAPGMSIMTALALAETLSEELPGKIKIKWPNDVLISGKKTAGILTELAADHKKISYVVVGVGINVNHRSEDFPDELKPIATSVRINLRKKCDRIALLQRFLVILEKEYQQYRTSLLKNSHKKLRMYSSLIGSEVSLKSGRREICGTVVDIDANGALMLEIDGQVRAITSGEVTVIKR
jgi:BirA family biotin operon repressor/biotin-[acetyl-CoA-carboxylase] ligase